jgi:hypothetical protein
MSALRFTVVVDDEAAGYPPSIWSYLLGSRTEVVLTLEHLNMELPVAVLPKAAPLKFVIHDNRKNTSIRNIQVKLMTANVRNVRLGDVRSRFQ